jgi:hypothetical protein
VTLLVCAAQPKRIHGRYLTAPELREYVVSYVKMFKVSARATAVKSSLLSVPSRSILNPP